MADRQHEENGNVVLQSPPDFKETPRTTTALSVDDLLASAQAFADEVAARPNHGGSDAPLDDLERMATLGLFTAPLPAAYGGLGLGTEPKGHLPLLHLLAIIGGSNLVLGRLYEGHVNALILIAAYGSARQLERAAHDARNGLLFGVWNTGGQEPLRLTHNDADDYIFSGKKTFASGAPFVSRPIVTAEFNGWQMTLPRMESSGVADAIEKDESFWHPLGMEASQSYSIQFTGAVIAQDDLIGAPGDFYRDPLFRGGAIRFAAVHAGAILRLHRLFTEWLDQTGRGGDPYQVARLGEVTLAAQEAVLWVERAATVAEEGFSQNADKLSADRSVAFANMMRVAIERAATATMQRVTAGVGAHGLLRPSPFERILRDLTMYLRQPAPDHTLAEVGRAAIRNHHVHANGAENGLWSQPKEGSLPPRYFQRIYQRSSDPWNFESSEYEAGKYLDSLQSLPHAVYDNVLEIGCSIGVFTQKLSARSESLLSLDVSEHALEIARNRCRDLPHVRFKQMHVPREFPEGRFDLVVLSEVSYYWNRADMQRAMDLLADNMRPGAHLLLVHFTGPVPDYPQTGDQVHQAWLARPEWKSLRGHRSEKYRLDLLERLD